jgi:excinuclease ABC subunit A
MEKAPNVDHIDWLSPAISIDQKTTSKNSALDSRARFTEIYDYLRLLWARIGVSALPEMRKGDSPADG